MKKTERTMLNKEEFAALCESMSEINASVSFPLMEPQVKLQFITDVICKNLRNHAQTPHIKQMTRRKPGLEDAPVIANEIKNTFDGASIWICVLTVKPDEEDEKLIEEKKKEDPNFVARDWGIIDSYLAEGIPEYFNCSWSKEDFQTK